MKYLKLFEDYEDVQIQSTPRGYLIYSNGSLIGGEWDARKEASEFNSSYYFKTFYLIYDKDTDNEMIEEIDIFSKMGSEYMVANQIAADLYNDGYYLISSDDYNWEKYEKEHYDNEI